MYWNVNKSCWAIRLITSHCSVEICENWESLTVPGGADPFRRMLPSVLIAAVCLTPDAISGSLFVMSADSFFHSTFLRSFINMNFSSKMGFPISTLLPVHTYIAILVSGLRCRHSILRDFPARVPERSAAVPVGPSEPGPLQILVLLYRVNSSR